MTTFKYLNEYYLFVDNVPNNVEDPLQVHLNIRGAEGWELVNFRISDQDIVGKRYLYQLVFKRAVPELETSQPLEALLS